MFGEALTGEYLLMSALFLLFPLVMAILLLVLKGKVNRWANIIVGMVAVILNIAAFSQTLTLDLSIYVYAIPMDISMILASALIVWYVWKLEQVASEPETHLSIF